MDYEINEMNYIWRSVSNNVGNRGHFLKSFAETWTCADLENKLLLKDVSASLIYTYKLFRPPYLP